MKGINEFIDYLGKLNRSEVFRAAPQYASLERKYLGSPRFAPWDEKAFSYFFARPYRGISEKPYFFPAFLVYSIGRRRGLRGNILKRTVLSVLFSTCNGLAIKRYCEMPETSQLSACGLFSMLLSLACYGMGQNAISLHRRDSRKMRIFWEENNRFIMGLAWRMSGAESMASFSGNVWESFVKSSLLCANSRMGLRFMDLRGRERELPELFSFYFALKKDMLFLESGKRGFAEFIFSKPRSLSLLERREREYLSTLSGKAAKDFFMESARRKELTRLIGAEFSAVSGKIKRILKKENIFPLSASTAGVFGEDIEIYG